jgi:hypothetical protein
MKSEIIVQGEDLSGMIFTVRGIQVMIDADLAVIYGVDTKVLNQAVKRNLERFPNEFRFQISFSEKTELVTICDRFVNLKHSSTLPYAFTEQGVAMLSAVLRSPTAIKTSIRVINAFVQMRRSLLIQSGLLHRIDGLEKRQMKHEFKTDERFEQIFTALESKGAPAQQGVFFEGQIFDAYVLINDLLRQAKKSIVLIDNYIDDTVLMQFAKRPKGVSALILTKRISKQLQQDLEKHNAQYPAILIKEFASSHDRFLILDQEKVYHIGASLKDLGKKWFAFSLMNKDSLAIMERVREEI